jgi:small-conductance mechanosensitive channel
LAVAAVLLGVLLVADGGAFRANAQSIPGIPLKALPKQSDTPAANAAPAQSVTSSQPSAEPIPLAQVADRAEELDLKLEEISRRLASSQAIPPEDAASAQASEIRERALHLDTFLHQIPDIVQLRDEVVYWRALNYRSAEQRRQLTARAAELQNQIAQLDDEQATWQATHDQIQDTAGIEVVANRVQHELTAIRTIRAQAQAQLNQVLTLQNQTSQTARLISDSLIKLSDAEERFRGSLLDRDSVPLWNRSAFQDSGRPITGMLRGAADQSFTTADEFLRGSGGGLLLLLIVYALALFAAFRLRRYMGSPGRGSLFAEAAEIFQRPYSIALLATLVVSIPVMDSAPISISVLFYLLWLAVVFRLTPLLVASEFRQMLYLLLGLNLLEAVRVGLPLPAGISRILVTAILLATLITFAWISRPSQSARIRLTGRPLLLVHWGLRFGLLLLGVALLANICGYVSLSHVLGIGTVLSAFFATALYFVGRVSYLLLVVFLQSTWAGAFPGELRKKIEVWGGRALAAGAVLLWWTQSELYVFLFQDSLNALATGVLGYSLGVGKMRITVGALLSVILIVGIGYAVAKGVSSLLRSLLLAKFPFQRGLPYAISKVVYYCLLVMVFAAAVTSAGVELNKFTVITGALGVGVGFGLQNIVSNFASGLILLFERPIRVEDTIEVNGLIGTVRRIGARSSTITTAQGAEVIVPNSNLLSNQVVNWTLSSPWRRVEIPVGVGYGCDPEAVLKLLVSVAAGHKEVMSEPAPAAYFLGFGDSALNFELRFWAAGQDTWFQLKSDVAILVAHALREAGIEIPFPQRDLHLRSIDSSLRSSLVAGGDVLAGPKPANGNAARNPAVDEEQSLR